VYNTNYVEAHIKRRTFLYGLSLDSKGKGKVIPLQARYGQEGAQRYSSTLP